MRNIVELDSAGLGASFQLRFYNIFSTRLLIEFANN